MRGPRKRGRPSAASLAVMTAQAAEIMPRQRPPHDLSDEEVEVWSAIVNAEAADWFSPSTAPILAQYCRHVIHARRVAQLIEKTLDDLHNPPSIEEYDKLLKMQERESRAIASLGTKMRLTHQSSRTDRENKRKIAPGKPWEG